CPTRWRRRDDWYCLATALDKGSLATAVRWDCAADPRLCSLQVARLLQGLQTRLRRQLARGRRRQRKGEGEQTDALRRRHHRCCRPRGGRGNGPAELTGPPGGGAPRAGGGGTGGRLPPAAAGFGSLPVGGCCPDGGARFVSIFGCKVLVPVGPVS